MHFFDLLNSSSGPAATRWAALFLAPCSAEPFGWHLAFAFRGSAIPARSGFRGSRPLLSAEFRFSNFDFRFSIPLRGSHD
jgi:hypothetical protein